MKNKNIITMSYESYDWHLNCKNLILLNPRLKLELITEVLKSIVSMMDKDYPDESKLPSMVYKRVDEIFYELRS